MAEIGYSGHKEKEVPRFREQSYPKLNHFVSANIKFMSNNLLSAGQPSRIFLT